MLEDRAPDGRALRAHALQIATLRIRAAEVAVHLGGMAWNDDSFGSLAGWIADALRKHTDQQIELVESLAENLELAADGLWLAAMRARHATRWARGLPRNSPNHRDDVVESMVIRGPRRLASAAPRYPHLQDRVRQREWMDEGLPGPRAEPEFDPPAWAIGELEPLLGMVAGLTGRPEVVAAQIAAFERACVELHSIGVDLRLALRPVLRWPGRNADEYLDLMNANVEGISGLPGLVMTLAEVARAAGEVVPGVRAAVTELAVRAVRDAHGAAGLPAAVEAARREAMRSVSALVASLTGLAKILD